MTREWQIIWLERKVIGLPSPVRKFFAILSIFLLQREAGKSIPRLTQGSGRSSGVEHNLAKVRVGRSNRLARSNILPDGSVKKAAAWRSFLFLR